MKKDEIIKKNLDKGFTKINNIQYALLGNAYVMVSDIHWLQNDEITHAGIAFSPADRLVKVGDFDNDNSGKPIEETQPVFVVKASNIESLIVVRDAIDRAIKLFNKKAQTNQSN